MNRSNRLFTQHKKEISLAPVMGGLIGILLLMVMARVVEATQAKANLSGVISDSKTGEPIEGALVTLDSSEVTTDSSGYYAFIGLNPGDYTLMVTRPGYGTEVVPLTLAAGDSTADIQITFITSMLTGTVLDNSTQLPIEGALVILSVLPSLATSVGLMATTDSNGVFSLVDLPPASYHLVVTKEGYYGHESYITLAEGDNATEVLLTLITSTLAGVVLDANTGIGIGDATVTLDGSTITTNANGAFNFEELIPGAYYIFVAKAGYYDYSASITLAAGNNTIDILLTLVTSSLVGVVIDADTGSAIEGALVTLDSSSITTSSDGNFAFETLLPGTYHLVVVKDEYYNYDDYITLVAGSNTITVPLIPIPVLTVTIEVTDDSNGEPIEGTLVTMDGFTGTTGSNGVYTFFENIHPNTYHLVVTKDRYHSYDDYVTLFPDTGVVISIRLIPTTSTLIGTVLDSASYFPIEGALVTLDTLEITTNGSGTFTFKDIAPGPYHLVVTKDGYYDYATEVALAPGSNIIDIPLVAQKARLLGIVLDADSGLIIEGALVKLNGLEQTTDIDGNFVFEGLDLGNHHLVVTKGGYYDYTTDITLAAGDNTIDVLLVAQKARLLGTVTDSDTGVPVGNALVALDALTTATDANGDFTFENLDPGIYHLVITKDGYYDYSTDLSLYAGNNTVNVPLAPRIGARFQVSDLTIEPSEVRIGEPIVVGVIVTNTGDAPGSYTVGCRVEPSAFAALEVVTVPWPDLIQAMTTIMVVGVIAKVISTWKITG